VIDAQAEYLAHIRLVGEVREVDGAFAVKTGAASNTENGVVAHGRVADVAALVDWFTDTPASWLDVGGLNHDALVAAGARPEFDGWEIVFDAADIAVEPWADVEVQRVHDLGHWFALAGPDYATLRPLYEQLVALPDRRVRFYVVENAGFAAAFFGERLTLFSHVGVTEQARRRGVGTALVAARLAEARGRVAVAPSRDGARLYESFGVEPRPLPPNRWYYLPSR
jgi:GNAT superfamily N-acetyltransferase